MDSSLVRSISFGPFRLYPAARVIERDGVRLAVGSRALDILIVLTERAGEVVSHKELIQRVWRSLVVSPSNLRVHVAGLRKALGEGEGESQYVANIPGQGYCFVAPIRRLESDGLGASAPEPLAPSPPPPPRRKHNLPSQVTSFIGREKEIQQLKGLLTSTRLLTLTGAGGCGKTRLALRVASEVLDGFPDGCWLVELASLGDSTLVVQTVANVLAIEEKGSGPLAEAISERLATKCLLLILDNAEHLVEPCAELADLLLRRCSGLEIVVTSREPLGVSGELTYRVPSLSTPEADDATADAVLACEATRLFVERVRLHRPDFEVTPKNVRALASICRRLDGIALAIELAAPRTRTMSIEELNGHLDDRFGLLTGGHRTALPRHRTLRSLIDWSYDLLSAAEKTMLRRVAVFAGGFTLDAAEFVCAGDSVDRSNALDLLTALIDKNILLAQTHEDATRFDMLETVRHYAWVRLRESGEEEPVRVRHLEYFVALAERLDEMQADTQRMAMLGRMEVEHDNLRAALAWCEATAARSVVGLRLAGKLELFWKIRGHFAEGGGWIVRLLAATPPGEPTEDHAVAHHTAGILAFHEAHYQGAEAHHRNALAIFQRLGQRQRIARTLGNLGNLALGRDEHQTARQLYEQGLAIAREVGDRRSIATGLHCLGLLASDSGDFVLAQELLEEGISIAREMGDWSPAAMLGELGRVRHVQGDLFGAHELLMEALGAERQFGNKVGIAMTLTWLGVLSHDLGNIAAAKTHLGEALTIEQAMNDQKVMALTLEAFASLCTELADPYHAAQLFGRTERLREEIGGAALEMPIEHTRSERSVAVARLALNDDAAFDRAWSEGRSMTLAEAVRKALAI